MGDRGQVLIKDSGVYLYTHWTATSLGKDVAKALTRGYDRWDDHEYLARIIFCEMVSGSLMDILGFGIGTQQHWDVWRLITVDVEHQTITESVYPFDYVKPYSFEYIQAYGDIPDASKTNLKK
ncbi:MAG: hypothetical protein PXY39_06285 [archaeon]|nr:hypothetical protein [archaeon]